MAKMVLLEMCADTGCRAKLAAGSQHMKQQAALKCTRLTPAEGLRAMQQLCGAALKTT